MTLPPPILKGRARLDRALEDACVDLAWLSRVYAGHSLGAHMAALHGHINELREAMALEARTDEEQAATRAAK